MNPIENSEIKFTIEFGSVNGSTMQLIIDHNDSQCVINPKSDATIEHTIKFTFPTKIKLSVSGKDMLVDTLIDSDGKIQKDKFVKISRLTIDGLPVPSIWLEKKIQLITETQSVVNSNYFGHNGQSIIELSKPNAFIQLTSFVSEI